jgi:hypothetical protein
MPRTHPTKDAAAPEGAETETQHTPGAWIAVKADINGDDPNRWAVCVDGDPQYFLATIENGAPGDTLDTEEANARLIAAAPDLLKGCALAMALFNRMVSADPSLHATVSEAWDAVSHAHIKATSEAYALYNKRDGSQRDS